MEVIKNSTGICFGGGGALGFAHLGVLKALEECGIYPYHVSGASMGAIIGALYASGYTSDEIVEIVKEHKIYNLTNILSFARTGWKAGFSGNRKIEDLLRHYIPHNSFKELKRPFSLSVVDFRRAECLIVSSGDKLIEHILASMSIPLAFKPEIIEENIYVDGGVMNNLPVEPLVPVCKTIIGVDVHTAHPFTGEITWMNMLTVTLRIMQKQMNISRAEKCHYYLTFPDLAHYEPDDFSKFEEIYRIGYETASRYIEQHPGVKVKTVFYSRFKKFVETWLKPGKLF